MSERGGGGEHGGRGGGTAQDIGQVYASGEWHASMVGSSCQAQGPSALTVCNRALAPPPTPAALLVLRCTQACRLCRGHPHAPHHQGRHHPQRDPRVSGELLVSLGSHHARKWRQLGLRGQQ